MVNTVAYFLEISEQTRQVSALAGNNITKSLIFEYAIINMNAKRDAYSNVLSVQYWQ
jgi:hypothetical protein